MPLISSLLRGYSGARASVLRQDISAHHIANLNTPGFKPQRIVQVESRVGGTEIKGLDHPFPAERNPLIFTLQEEDRIQNPLTLLSEVNLAEEVVQQILALRSLQANLAVIRTADQMSDETTGLKK